MPFRHGAAYTVEQIDRRHPDWQGVWDAVERRRKPDSPPIRVETIYSVKWRQKPFPWSYFHEVKPHRRFFWHGTPVAAIQRILEEGFKVGDIGTARHGRMLGHGVYATYHTNKGRLFAPDGYIVSVCVYAPNVLCVHPGQTVSAADLFAAPRQYDAVEVRTGATMPGGWTMRNHEICVFDPRRVYPRFIVKVS